MGKPSCPSTSQSCLPWSPLSCGTEIVQNKVQTCSYILLSVGNTVFHGNASWSLRPFPHTLTPSGLLLVTFCVFVVWLLAFVKYDFSDSECRAFCRCVL